MQAISKNERFLKEAIVFGNIQIINRINSPVLGCVQVTTIPHIIEFIRNLIETGNDSKIISNLLNVINSIQRCINDNKDPSGILEILKRYFNHDMEFAEILFNTIVKLAVHKNTFFGPGKTNWFGYTNKTASIEILERELLRIPKKDTISILQKKLNSQDRISPHPAVQPSPLALALQSGSTSSSCLFKLLPTDDCQTHSAMIQTLKKILSDQIDYPEFETDLECALMIYNTDGKHDEDRDKNYFFNGIFAGKKYKIARSGRCQISFNVKENSWEIFIISDHQMIKGGYKYIRQNNLSIRYNLTEKKVNSVQRYVSPSQKSPAFFQGKCTQSVWKKDGFKPFVKIGKNGPYISHLSPYLGKDLLDYLDEKRKLLNISEKRNLGKMFLKEIFSKLRAEGGKVFDIKIENTLVVVDFVTEMPTKINIIDYHTIAATNSLYPKHLQSEMSKYQLHPNLFACAVESLNTRYLEIIITFASIVSCNNPQEKFSEKNLELMLQLIEEIEAEYQSQHKQGTQTLQPLVDIARIHYVWKELIQNPVKGRSLLAN